jgi:hypothetical protein
VDAIADMRLRFPIKEMASNPENGFRLELEAALIFGLASFRLPLYAGFA